MGVGGIELQADVTEAELRKFAQIFASITPGEGAGDALREKLAAAGLHDIGVEEPFQTRKSLEPMSQQASGAAQAERDHRRARSAYGEAGGAVASLDQAARNSGTINLRQARRALQNIVDLLLKDPMTVLSLSTLRAHDEYTQNHSVNVALLSMALANRIGFSKVELADLGLAALFHDIGKPDVAWRGTDGRLHYYARPGYSARSHEQVSVELAAQALSRLRYPNELRARVLRLIRAHMLDPGRGDPVRARRLLARYGRGLTFELLDHKEADLRGKGRPPTPEDVERLARFRQTVEGELRSPYRLRDLAVNGNDLIALGIHPGPAIGKTLRELLDDVIRDPTHNTREHLLARARELQP